MYEKQPKEVVEGPVAVSRRMTPEKTMEYINTFYPVPRRSSPRDKWMGMPGAKDTGVLQDVAGPGANSSWKPGQMTAIAERLARRSSTRASSRRWSATWPPTPFGDALSRSPSTAGRAVRCKVASRKSPSASAPARGRAGAGADRPRRSSSGEFVCILGPSGCGKSTLLTSSRLRAADHRPVPLDGRPIARPGADRGVVFQQHALLPWMSVRDNVALRPRRAASGGRSARAIARDATSIWSASTGFASTLSVRALGRHAAARRHRARARQRPRGAADGRAVRRARRADPRAAAGGDPARSGDAPARPILCITHSIEEALFLATHVVVMTRATRPHQGGVRLRVFARGGPADRDHAGVRGGEAHHRSPAA